LLFAFRWVALAINCKRVPLGLIHLAHNGVTPRDSAERAGHVREAKSDRGRRRTQSVSCSAEATYRGKWESFRPGGDSLLDCFIHCYRSLVCSSPLCVRELYESSFMPTLSRSTHSSLDHSQRHEHRSRYHDPRDHDPHIPRQRIHY
jgi:hypothetical protein